MSGTHELPEQVRCYCDIRWGVRREEARQQIQKRDLWNVSGSTAAKLVFRRGESHLYDAGLSDCWGPEQDDLDPVNRFRADFNRTLLRSALSAVV